MKFNYRIPMQSLLLAGLMLAAGNAATDPGNKVTGDFVRVISPEIAWEMYFSAHEEVVNHKGKIRPAKGMAMGQRILPNDELFWVMTVTCVEVFSDNYARFAGIYIDHFNPERIGLPVAFEAHDYANPGNDVDHLRPKMGDYTPEDCPADECTAYEFAQAFCDGYSDPPEWAYWYVTEGNVNIHFD